MKFGYACGKVETLKPPSKSMKAENGKNGFVKIASKYSSEAGR